MVIYIAIIPVQIHPAGSLTTALSFDYIDIIVLPFTFDIPLNYYIFTNRLKLRNARSRIATQSDLHSGGGYTNTLCEAYLITNTLARIDSELILLVNQQCVVYQFKCNLCDTGSYVGYLRGHLYARVDGHKSTSSSVRKHYDNEHAGAFPEDLLSCFKVLKKCMNKFDCLFNEMLYITQLTPTLNVQADSIRAKVFV